MSDPLTPLRDETGFTVYTIYERPRDAPDWYVLRAYDILRGHPQPVPRASSVRFTDLETARKVCIELGLERVDRAVDDDACIVESWL
jgi:hypothetical protein